MPITTTYAPITYMGDGAATAFPITFPYQLQTDIVVHTLLVSTQATTLLVLGTDYTITPTLNSPALTGTVTTVGPIPTGTDLIISRAVPLTQDTTWVPNDPNLSTSTMNAVDKLTMIVQDFNANPLNPGGDTSTFVRGDGSLSNELIGTLGPAVVPSDAQTVMQAGQNGAAAYKVIAGATADASYRFANDGSSNPWASQWVYDPNIAAIGWQPYGGSIKGTFGDNGNVAFGGALAVAGALSFGGALTGGTADASLITGGVFNVARLGSGSGNANTFLNGVGVFTIPAGGGGINTTTTGTFVIAAVNSTQTVPVTDATDIVVGTYLQISDGTHTINGLVTNVASLNLTVKTNSIILGTAGNTMASGAAVQGATSPGNNSILITDAATAPLAMTELQLSGSDADRVANGVFTLPLFISGSGGGTSGVGGYINLGAAPTTIIEPTAGGLGAGLLGANATDTAARYFTGTARYQVPVFDTFGGPPPHFPLTITWQLLTNDSITTGTLTPDRLNCTNALTDGELFGYDSGTGHFKMFSASAVFGGTDAQFVNGTGAVTNVLNGPFLVSGLTPVANTKALRIAASTSPVGVSYNTYNYDGVSAYSQASNPTFHAFDAPVKALAYNASYTNIDGTGSVVEMGYFDGVIRTTKYGRAAGGWWDLQSVVTNPTGTQTLNLATASYYKFTNILSSFTIALADSNALPVVTTYAGEMTIEFDGVGANTVTWPGTITWVDGGTAPAPDATNTTIIKLIRSQFSGGAWIGYRLASSTAAAYTDAQARSAVLTTTAFPATSSTINWTVTAGTSVVPEVKTSGILNTHIAPLATPGGGISPSKIWGAGSSTATYLRNDGTWAIPPGTGGGGGSFSPNNAYTWTARQDFTTTMNTFSRTFPTLSNSTIDMRVNGLYPQISYQDADALNVTIVDNYVTPPGGAGMGVALLLHTVNGRTIGGESIHHFVNLQSELTSGFNLSHTQITQTKRMNGADSSAWWWNNWGPDSSFVSLPDEDGIVHEYNSGTVRIGEVNYGNAWGDFGMVTRGVGSRWVAGIELFPDWLNGSTGDSAWRLANGIAEPHHYNASWALAIGGAGPDSYGVTPKNWKGLYITTDGVVGKNDHSGIIGGGSTGNTNGGGGYALDLHGSSGATNPIGKAINVSDYIDVGIDLSAATFTNTGTNLGAQAIALADDQSIRLGTIWLRGHSGTLQYSTNGTSWSTVTLP